MKERQTQQKQIIYSALMTLDHPTATEVYAYVHETHPTVSRATVFRVLGGFADHGKALELRAAGSEVRYDYNVTPHYHARCECCGRVADVKMTGLDEGCLRASAEHGFSVRGYSVEFFGICKNCQEGVKS